MRAYPHGYTPRGTYPVQLVIEVGTDWSRFDDEDLTLGVEVTKLVAFVGQERIELGQTDMSGYRAQNNAREFLQELFQDLFK